MGQFAITLQALGAVGLVVGLFVVLPWGLALAIVGLLGVASGTALEVAAHHAHPVAEPTATERRRAVLREQLGDQYHPMSDR